MNNNIGQLQDKNGNSLFPENTQIETINGDTIIKFPNGQMIIYGERSISYTISDFWSWCDRTNAMVINYPIQFSEKPTVLLTSNSFHIVGVCVSARDNSSFTAYGYQPKGQNGTGLYLMFQAIGKWK